MARIRYLKPDFFVDPDLTDLTFAHRLIFAGLWCYADKAGRLRYEPKKLKVQIAPFDSLNMVNILQDLTKKPFIQIYEVEGVKYIQVVNWKKHQNPHNTEKESVIPLFNGYITVKQPLDNVGLPISSHSHSNISSHSNIAYDDFEASVFKQWNDFVEKYPILSKVKEISEKRRKSLKARFENKSFLVFDAILFAIQKQPFLMGVNDRKWKVSFDWLIENDTNYLKVLEMKYSDKSITDLPKKEMVPDLNCKVCDGKGFLQAQFDGKKKDCKCLHEK